MHNAWICGDYVARGYYASISSDCLGIISSLLWWPPRSFHHFPTSPILHFILFSLSTQFPSVVLLPLPLSSSLSSSPPPPSTPPPSLLWASGCLPTSDVLLARWCMQISCVFLTLTHVDICTALWDYALGHISCNDENDDADENSGEAGSPWVGVGDYFLPLSLLQYQSVQWVTMV